jgi:hypothetical protein
MSFAPKAFTTGMFGGAIRRGTRWKEDSESHASTTTRRGSKAAKWNRLESLFVTPSMYLQG